MQQQTQAAATLPKCNLVGPNRTPETLCAGHLQSPMFGLTELTDAYSNKPMWKPNSRGELQCKQTAGNLNFSEWNLVEPDLLTVEPLCGTLWNLNF